MPPRYPESRTSVIRTQGADWQRPRYSIDKPSKMERPAQRDTEMLYFSLMPWILFNIFTSSPMLVPAEGRLRSASIAQRCAGRAVRSRDLNRIGRRTINVHVADHGAGAGWNLLGAS